MAKKIQPIAIPQTDTLDDFRRATVVVLNRLVQDINARLVDIATTTTTTTATTIITASGTAELPGAVAIVSGTSTAFVDPATQQSMQRVSVVYTAPTSGDYRNFTGVDVWVEVPSETSTASLDPTGQQLIAVGLQPALLIAGSTNTAVFTRPSPSRDEKWRVYLNSHSSLYDSQLKLSTATDSTTSTLLTIAAPTAVNVSTFAVSDGTKSAGGNCMSVPVSLRLPGTGTSWIPYDWERVELQVKTTSMAGGDKPAIVAVFDRNTAAPGTTITSRLSIVDLPSATGTWTFTAQSYDTRGNAISSAPTDTAIMSAATVTVAGSGGIFTYIRDDMSRGGYGGVIVQSSTSNQQTYLTHQAFTAVNTGSQVVAQLGGSPSVGTFALFDASGVSKIDMIANSTSPYINLSTTGFVAVNGTQVVAARQAAVTAPVGGGTVDAEARTAINDLISRLQSHGLIS